MVCLLSQKMHQLEYEESNIYNSDGMIIEQRILDKDLNVFR